MITRAWKTKRFRQYGLYHADFDIVNRFCYAGNQNRLTIYLLHDVSHIVEPFCLPGPGNHGKLTL
ncbi:MAG: hypothetical protein Barrevirus1_43 [Barrevirus sp.]|uniref:Uncharacterized protein n=1 Tax=Barrevirus sp. TaxID=2487763 RepID=A0A3G4ZS42_9VIRU|nr:MAG: hypothetical protein Barrevirus1_43 [Barrevirus sp.]